MPLIVDVRVKVGLYDEWRETGRLGPGMKGSISHNKPDGTRMLYEFECADDDSYGVLNLSEAGIDITAGPVRSVLSTTFRELARLRDGQYYLFAAKTDVSPEPRIVRIRHER